MRRDEFYYDLPENLIAQHPASERGDSRLLQVERKTGQFHDYRFADLPSLLQEGDLLVFNDTRVIPARLHARKETGGRGEILVERLLDEQRMLAQVRFSKTPKESSRIILEKDHALEVTERHGDFLELALTGPGVLSDIIQDTGHVPLPPYIQRSDEHTDQDRYQTVYARSPGAVAAPTAGLHFTDELLQALKQQGVESVFVTLHVGAGTFQPVRVENIEEHHMHAEYLEIPEDICRQVNTARAENRRIIAVGTTAVRCLETALSDGELVPYKGETDIFIYPGYAFRVVDALITNFHLPESTLLMLACAFAGRELTLAAYAHAIEQQYRFYSYGDAMFIS